MDGDVTLIALSNSVESRLAFALWSQVDSL